MQDEISSLSTRYGAPRRVIQDLPTGTFSPLSTGRTAEVAMVVLRKNGRLLLNTKEFYPQGTFRIPTGGVKQGESVEAALTREVGEETNLNVEVMRFLCLITYNAPERAEPFTTYAFQLSERSGELRVNDPKERISAWQEVEPEALRDVADRLAGLDGEWRAWGIFRSTVHRVVADLLTED